MLEELKIFLTVSKRHAFWRVVDLNQDGQLDYHEFVSIVFPGHDWGDRGVAVQHWNLKDMTNFHVHVPDMLAGRHFGGHFDGHHFDGLGESARKLMHGATGRRAKAADMPPQEEARALQVQQETASV